MTFWDFCAPFYDKAEQANSAYNAMLRRMSDLTPKGARVFEAAGGTGSISLAVASKASTVVCTDISSRMIAVGMKKAAKLGVSNVIFGCQNIFDTGEPENSFDVVIASQILHLIDEPKKAADELKRISKGQVITAVALLKNLKGLFARPSVGIWRLLGFAPKIEFDKDTYKEFLNSIGLPPSHYEVVPGNMPIAVAVYNKPKE